MEWENSGDVPTHVFDTFSKHNMLIPNLPAPLPAELLKSLGVHELLGGLKIEDFDHMHFSIYISEMKRAGLGGPPHHYRRARHTEFLQLLRMAARNYSSGSSPTYLQEEREFALVLPNLMWGAMSQIYPPQRRRLRTESSMS
jgi:hypothetical protein